MRFLFQNLCINYNVKDYIDLFLKQITKLRTQADEQEESLQKQEEEVHGKKREYERLKAEEKELLEDIKKTEREVEKLEEDIRIANDLDDEVRANFIQLDGKT